MRKWILGGLAAVALFLPGFAYHNFVVRRNAEHYRLMVEALTPRTRDLHYREVFRYYDPLDVWPARAREWMAEEIRQEGETILLPTIYLPGALDLFPD